jgi:hypothetical protein
MTTNLLGRTVIWEEYPDERYEIVAVRWESEKSEWWFLISRKDNHAYKGKMYDVKPSWVTLEDIK